ncbi:MAG: family 78 glycoside hydrolase catalytic domain [Oscillospiraceae bacterium]|nr:family 78 glycoside hydrolase catalytic domain [Oscillospiraceae bacterium]
MNYIKNAEWIKPKASNGEAGLTFFKAFDAGKEVKKAEIEITALGVYKLFINGSPAHKSVLMPGWTDYFNRLQVQTYDITPLIKAKNKISVEVGQGWLFHDWYDEESPLKASTDPLLIAAVRLVYCDGAEEFIYTNSSWKVRESIIRYNNIYNGETVDFSYSPSAFSSAAEVPYSKDILIPQEGEYITEQERFSGRKLIKTPKGETVIDFGQEITGYITFNSKLGDGKKAKIVHFEMLDKDGNVYTANLRSAKQTLTVIGDGKEHEIKPIFTFYGFRYIKVTGIRVSDPSVFTAIAVNSEMERTGDFVCSDPYLNKLYSNIIWGQKGNFLDVPTDCPQRNERLGWTGDAQVFCKTASLNFDVYTFFKKWMGDLRSSQKTRKGMIPSYVPCHKDCGGGSAAWADVATILPWQMYLTYGNKDILKENWTLMKNWVDYMVLKAKKKVIWEDDEDLEDRSTDPYLHNNQWHFGDWLSLDLPNLEACEGATNKHLIAQAFFCYSAALLIKAGKVLGKNVEAYEKLYEKIVDAFNNTYINENGEMTSNTQTACVLALWFNLAKDRRPVTEQLLRLINESGHLTTGFVGTPYLLPLLSSLGETKLAYDLILRKEFPSWLYPVTKGATTMWERWNGIRPDGEFADVGMNSFNHYAYGAVGQWMYENMAGIRPDGDVPAYEKILFAPETDSRLTFVKASIKTRRGEIVSQWSRTNEGTEYTFIVPEGCKARAIIGTNELALNTGINKIFM